jgi:hypothetical protein
MKSTRNFKYLILLFAMWSVPALAQSRFMVSAGPENICAIDGEGLKCWGKKYTLLDPPKLRLPTQVTQGNSHKCALDAEGVKCWGDNRSFQTEVPPLNKPVQVSAGSDFTCALDRDGVKCWGGGVWRDPFWKIGLKNPTQVSISERHVCILDAEGLKCAEWNGKEFAQENDVPKLRNPVQVTTGRDHACALDADGVQCWGARVYERSLPGLKSPTQISSGQDHVCVLDAEGVKCWDWSFQAGVIDVPQLKSPIQVSAGGDHACALDLEGIKCWGGWDPQELKPPPLILDLTSEAISILASPRAEYLKAIFNVAHHSDLAIPTQYFEYLLVSPAILGTDSRYVTEIFASQWKKTIDWHEKYLGYSDRKDGLMKTQDSEKHRMMAITSIRSSLTMSLNFLNLDSQVAVQDRIRAAGVALVEPMNNQKIKDLLMQIDSLNSEKQKLRSTQKSAFLVDSLELAATWLREKVK